MPSDTSITTCKALLLLLELHGLPANGTDILQAMEAPWLFLKRGGTYTGGASMLSPAWLNNYLLPRGFCLAEHPLHRREVRAFLASHSPAVLLLPGGRALLIRRTEGQHVTLLQSAGSIQLTVPTLLKKLPETCTALTIEACPPQPVDVIPLLCESVRTLAAWRHELPAMLSKCVTRQEMQPLHQQFFRALLVDMPALAHLYPDVDLAMMFMELSHIYRHLFIIGEHKVLLRERLPLGMLSRCTVYLQELIIDRLAELDAPEKILAPLYQETR